MFQYHSHIVTSAESKVSALTAPEILPAKPGGVYLCQITSRSQVKVFVEKARFVMRHIFMEEGDILHKMYANDVIVDLALRKHKVLITHWGKFSIGF